MGTNTSFNAEDGASPVSRRSSGSGSRTPSQQAPTTPTAAAADASSPAATTVNTTTNNNAAPPTTEPLPILNRPYAMSDRTRTQPAFPDTFQPSVVPVLEDNTMNNSQNGRGTDVTRGRERQRETVEVPPPARCINPASEVNSRLDTQVEVRVYPCNNNQSSGKKKFTTFTIKPEVCIVLLAETVQRILF